MTQASFPGMPERLIPVSPSKMTTWVDCPRLYRFRYLDVPRPASRPARAHTHIGTVTHNVLRDFWDVAASARTPAYVRDLVQNSWIGLGFKDEDQSNRWRAKVTHQVTAYLKGIDRERQPLGVERTVAFAGEGFAFTGRIDRLDERDGELVVVDYKTSRVPPTEDHARTSLALALYAVAAARMWHRPVHRVELHHVPTGEVVSHVHTDDSLARKVGEAVSITADLRRAAAEHADVGSGSALFAPTPTAVCMWCDMRAHCPEGQRIGPEKSDWAGLAED